MLGNLLCSSDGKLDGDREGPSDGKILGSKDGKMDGCDRESNVSSGKYDDFNAKVDGISYANAKRKHDVYHTYAPREMEPSKAPCLETCWARAMAS